jgi:hypothetical protein
VGNRRRLRNPQSLTQEMPQYRHLRFIHQKSEEDARQLRGLKKEYRDKKLDFASFSQPE